MQIGHRALALNIWGMPVVNGRGGCWESHFGDMKGTALIRSADSNATNGWVARALGTQFAAWPQAAARLRARVRMKPHRARDSGGAFQRSRCEPIRAKSFVRRA